MFRFAHPELLYLLIVIPLLIVFYVVMIRRKKKAIAEFGNPELLGPLMPLLSFKRGTWKFVMLMLALLFVIVGVAGPQFGSKLQQVKKKGVELMIALDVSNSMMAQDIKPSRLEKAKMAISRMVEKLSNDKIGLIVFAGDAYVQLPITTDYSRPSFSCRISVRISYRYRGRLSGVRSIWPPGRLHRKPRRPKRLLSLRTEKTIRMMRLRLLSKPMKKES